MKILFVGDDRKLFNAINRELNSAQAEVKYTSNGEEGLKTALEAHFDLIVLDWALPKKSGLSVLQELRGHKSLAPVLMLTGENSVEDVVLSLESGANACVKKPFEVPVLVSRMKALLRREKWDRGAVISYAHIRVDPVSHKVWRDGKEVELTAKEYCLLAYLIRNQERVVTRMMIAESVWDREFDTFTNIIDVYMNYLRKKIDRGSGRKLIHTVRGTGYVFKVADV